MNEVTAGVRELAGHHGVHGILTSTCRPLRMFASCVRPYTHLLCPLPMPPSRAFPGPNLTAPP